MPTSFDRSTSMPGKRIHAALDEALITLASGLAQPELREVSILRTRRLIREELAAGAPAVVAPHAANRLASLFEYMCTRLSYAEVHGLDAPLVEVRRLLEDLRAAWPSLDTTRTAITRSSKANV